MCLFLPNQRFGTNVAVNNLNKIKIKPIIIININFQMFEQANVFLALSSNHEIIEIIQTISKAL